MGIPRRLGTLIFAVLSLAPSLQACAEGLRAGSTTKAHTAPMKSNGSGISVQYRIDGELQPGGAVKVIITLGGVSDPAGSSVRIVADSGLALGVPDVIQGLSAGPPTTLTVPAVIGNGIGYLHVFTTQDGITSVTSIPVQAGKAAVAPPAGGRLKQMPDGEKIFSMPVK